MLSSAEGPDLKTGLYEISRVFDSNESGVSTEIVSRSLEKLSENAELTSEEQVALEAIVLPRLRPVVTICNGTYSTPPPPWEQLGEWAIRRKLEACIPSVGRINVGQHTQSTCGGTGFLVGANLLMTNRNVAEIFADGLGTENVMFRNEQIATVDFDDENAPNIKSPVTVTRVVMIHPYWDMALLQVEGLSPQQIPLTLSAVAPEGLEDRDIALISHPAQDPRSDLQLQDRIFSGVYHAMRLQPGKLKVRRKIESYGRTVDALTHDTSTVGLHSGAPVIDLSSGHVVGLQFATQYLDANYAVPMYDLVRDPRVVDAGVNFASQVEADSKYAWAWQKVMRRDRPEAIQYDVFLSYNARDMAAATEIVGELERRGVKTWVDVAQLVPGESYAQGALNGVQASGSVALLIAGSGLGPWQNQEFYSVVYEAARNQKSIIPILLPGAPEPGSLEVAPLLRNLKYVDCRKDLDFDRIAKEVSAVIGHSADSQIAEPAVDRFDIFHCFLEADREQVWEIAEGLGRLKVRSWPGVWDRSQDQLLHELLSTPTQRIPALAVIIGNSGGPWANDQLESFIWACVEQDRLVIPLILPGVSRDPTLPVFLRRKSMIDFRKTTPNPITQLANMLSADHGKNAEATNG